MLTRQIFIAVNKISNDNCKETGIYLILSYSFRHTDTKIWGLSAVCVYVFRDLFDISLILDITWYYSEIWNT